VAAGRCSVGVEDDTYIPEGAGSRCILEAVDRGNVELAAAYSILEGEADRRIFEVAAGRSILGLADSKRLVFQLVDSGTWIRPLPSKTPRIVNSRFER